MIVYDVTIRRAHLNKILKIGRGLSEDELYSHLESFALDHWDNELLSEPTKSPWTNISKFYSKMKNEYKYNYQEREVADPDEETPANLDEIQLSPLDVQVLEKAVRAAMNNYQVSISREIGLEPDETYAILRRIRDQLRE